MLKASNNHFIDWSRIKIPKIRPFYNLKSAKISKKCEKILSASILEDTACTKLKKNTPSERRDQMYLLHIYIFFFVFWKCYWVGVF